MLGGVIPSADQLTKKAIMAALLVPEGFIMLIIAIAFDAFGIFLFFASFFGVGLVASLLSDITGSLIFGFWTTSRLMFRGVVEQAVGNVSEKVLNVGGGLEGEEKKPSPGIEVGKKIAKTGIKISISAIRFFIFLLIELIPFLGDIFPSWTLMVIFELIQGEL